MLTCFHILPVMTARVDSSISPFHEFKSAFFHKDTFVKRDEVFLTRAHWMEYRYRHQTVKLLIMSKRGMRVFQFALHYSALFCCSNNSIPYSLPALFVVAHALVPKPRPHLDNDSKKARSMENANDLRLYTATAQCIVGDSPVRSSSTLWSTASW
jgi:hypothetical protein